MLLHRVTDRQMLPCPALMHLLSDSCEPVYVICQSDFFFLSNDKRFLRSWPIPLICVICTFLALSLQQGQTQSPSVDDEGSSGDINDDGDDLYSGSGSGCRYQLLCVWGYTLTHRLFQTWQLLGFQSADPDNPVRPLPLPPCFLVIAALSSDVQTLGRHMMLPVGSTAEFGHQFV